MKTASFILLLIFIGLVLICLLACISYIIYIFETTGFLTILGIIMAGAILISAATADRNII